MRSVLRDRIFIEVDEELSKYIQKKLTYTIPIKVGAFETRFVKLFDFRLVNSRTLSIPIGRTDLIPSTHEVLDKRTINMVDFHIQDGIAMRPSQQLIYDQVEDSCIVNAGCSFGKTFTALFLAEKLGQKTIVIVHTKKLQDQWVVETKKVLGINPGVVGGGMYEVDHDIVIATKQTLDKKADSVLFNTFGTVILDECLDYETKIETKEHGLVKIGKIVNNKLICNVKSWNGKEFEWKPLSNWFKNKYNDLMIKFITTNGVLKCTLNHNIYDMYGTKKPAEYFKVGDYFMGEDKAIKINAIAFEYPTYNNRFNITVEDNHNYLANGKLVGNCHHAPAKSFNALVDKFRARYKIGLTATLRRKDEKQFLINNYLSNNNIYKPKTENSLTPEIFAIRTDIMLPGAISWQGRVSKLIENSDYTGLILEIVNHQVSKGHKVLCLGSRVGFLKRLNSLTQDSELIIGGSKDTNEVISNVHKGITNVIFGSTQIMSEGISINPLSCLIYATPFSSDIVIEQTVGRVIRIAEGKLNPVVFDIILRGQTGNSQWRERKKYYDSKGYKITEITI